MNICWLRFFLDFEDDVLWALLRRFGTQGIDTVDLEWMMDTHDLLDGADLFFFEPAGTSIGTDGSMHHLADGGHAQHGASELTARGVVAAMRCSDKKLGSGGGGGGMHNTNEFAVMRRSEHLLAAASARQRLANYVRKVGKRLSSARGVL
jgi:hypothetical protein